MKICRIIKKNILILSTFVMHVMCTSITDKNHPNIIASADFVSNKNSLNLNKNNQLNELVNKEASLTLEAIKNGILKIKEKYKENDNTPDPIDNMYDEILEAEAKNELLKNGNWFKISKNIERGISVISQLGMCFEGNQRFSKKTTKISNFIKNVRYFEKKLLEERFDSPDSLYRIESYEKDISQYYASILILNDIFNKITYSSENNSKIKKFVSTNDTPEEGKISQKSSCILNELEIFLINKYEEILLSKKSFPKPIISTITNLLSEKSMEIMNEGNEILGWKNFKKNYKDNLDEISNNYSLQTNFLNPHGALWTLMNNEELVEGNWQLPEFFQKTLPKEIIYKREEKKIFHIIYNISEFIEVLVDISNNITITSLENKKLKKNDNAFVILEKDVMKIFNEKYKDFDIKKTIKSIELLRTILEMKKNMLYENKYTKGRKYVGKWVSDSKSQLSEHQYTKISSLLDYLSCFAIGLVSNFEVESLVNYTEIKNSKGVWIHESDSEREKRKSKNNQILLFGTIFIGIAISFFNVVGVASVGLVVVFLVLQLGLYSARSLNENDISFSDFVTNKLDNLF